ncbi:hypothetical protein Tco_0703495 [Tanacetum coccineum]|uniref:Uncharacterized protein n=1 Tax=Tanacetum coccineum TaxID=301880 RepID=A0ABQ4XZK7_9ASTR
MAALQYKDDHNRIAYLGRERGSEDFTDILSYLDHSPLRYALTHAPPVVFDSLVKQFWATATVRPNAAGSHDLVALFDGREGEEIPLTPPMLAIAAAGNDAADDDDAANEDNVAADEAAGSAAEAHPVPHSPPVSPVRELTPERQSASERPPSLSPNPPAQTFSLAEPLVFGPEPRPAGYVDPDVLEPIIFGPQPRPSDFVAPDLEESCYTLVPHLGPTHIAPVDIDNLVSMEDDTSVDSMRRPPVRPDDAPTPTTNAAGRAEDPTLLTSLSAKLDRCMGRIDSLETELGTSKKIMGGAILTLVSRSGLKIKPAVPSEDTEGTAKRGSLLVTSAAADKGKAPIPELDIPAEFLAEDAQARQRLEEEQASERLKQLVELNMPSWGSNPALGKRLLGRIVTEANFVERMTAIKEKKKRALADLRYRALKGKPMQQSEVTQMMRNLVKNQWCAAHNGTITMKAVKAMSKQQLIEEYEYICRRLEKDRLLSAQYNLFRPKPVISEPPSKRQRVDSDTSQPSGVPAASTQHADDPDSAGGGSFKPAGSATPMAGFAVPDTAGGTLGTNVTASTIPTSAAMDSAGSHRESGVSPFADSADSSSPSPVSTDHIPIDVLFESTSGGINEFFLDSDEDEQIGMSRVAADPDSDDEVLAEIIFRGQSISGHGVVVVDKLPDDEIVDPRVKVETISESASSPPRSRRKHRGVRSDDSLWDKPVEDFFSSESESDDDMENYIPPLPYGAFKDWEMVLSLKPRRRCWFRPMEGCKSVIQSLILNDVEDFCALRIMIVKLAGSSCCSNLMCLLAFVAAGYLLEMFVSPADSIKKVASADSSSSIPADNVLLVMFLRSADRE